MFLDHLLLTCKIQYLTLEISAVLVQFLYAKNYANCQCRDFFKIGALLAILSRTINVLNT